MYKLYKYKDVVQMLVDVIEQAEQNNDIVIVDRPMGWESVRDYAEEVVSDIPSAENKGEWIPCSERLPSGYEQVLVNVIEQNRVYDIVLCYTELVEKYYARGAINAWMPLPEPFSRAFACWANNHKGWSKTKKRNRRLARRKIKRGEWEGADDERL